MPIQNFLTKHKSLLVLFGLILIILIVAVIYVRYVKSSSDVKVLSLSKEKSQLTTQLSIAKQAFDALKNEDQYKKNQALQEEIKNIHDDYQKAVTSYQNLLDLKLVSKDTQKYDELFAKTLKYLSDKNYASAEATLNDLNKQMQAEKDKIAAASVPKVTTKQAAVSNDSAPVSNTAPSGGFSRQKVHSDVGDFTVDIVAADLGSTRVIVDTASDSDCHDNCPVLSLADYVARNGAYAGINGSYFCPATYPSCAGKTNSFDLLVMNKNKHYFNSDNNVYSTNPAVIFGNGFIRFVGQVSQWGRDTSVDGVLSNYPLLVSGNQVVYGGGGDAKNGNKGPRGFVANKGNTVYIGFVYNATMGESAHVLQSLGVDNAMNLDEGGSTALWYGGYKAGPGRNIPNAILFVRK